MRLFMIVIITVDMALGSQKLVSKIKTIIGNQFPDRIFQLENENIRNKKELSEDGSQTKKRIREFSLGVHVSKRLLEFLRVSTLRDLQFNKLKWHWICYAYSSSNMV